MDTKEHLLICLMEECAEVQQAAAKMLRFGPDCYNPTVPNSLSNLRHLNKEVTDVTVLMNAINAEFDRTDEAKIVHEADEEDKKLRLQKYMQVSRDLGLLE